MPGAETATLTSKMTLIMPASPGGAGGIWALLIHRCSKSCWSGPAWPSRYAQLCAALSAFPKVTLKGVARALKLAVGKADAAVGALQGDL